MKKSLRKRISLLIIFSVVAGLPCGAGMSVVSVRAAVTKPAKYWHLKSIGQPEVKERIGKSGRVPGEGVVVAVIDTGVDITHPALINHLWVNEAEKNGKKGVDDDGNGYVDDINGVNIYNSSAPVDDSHGHGTQISGIIAMDDTETGEITGVAPGARIMCIKLASGKDFTIDAAIEGIKYAVDNGADIINMSFATKGDNPGLSRLRPALVTASKRCMLVSSAGNENDNTKDSPSYPAAYDFVTGVMSYGEDEKISDFSNWDIDPGIGAEYEIAAPGEYIYSATKDGKYNRFDGTSHATAVVSGAMAVILSELRSAGKEIEPVAFKKWFAESVSHTTVPDSLHQLNAYRKLYLPDILDAVEKLDPSEYVVPETTSEPEVSPTPTETPVKLKKGTVEKAGKGSSRASYRIKSSKAKTVIYYRSLVSKTAKTATIPAKVRLSDGVVYTVVSAQKGCFSKRKNIRKLVVKSKKITVKMINKAVKGSRIRKVCYFVCCNNRKNMVS